MNTEDKILDFLLRGCALTTLSCQHLFHTSELRTYISRLIRRDYNVVSEWIKVEADGRKVKVKRYSIGS